MPFMIRVNTIDNCLERGTFGSEDVKCYDDKIDATREYDKLLSDMRDRYNDTADKSTMVLMYLYEYQVISHGDRHNIFITSLIRSSVISWYNYEMFVGLRQ